jgi:hypothetical protein
VARPVRQGQPPQAMYGHHKFTRCALPSPICYLPENTQDTAPGHDDRHYALASIEVKIQRKMSGRRLDRHLPPPRPRLLLTPQQDPCSRVKRGDGLKSLSDQSDSPFAKPGQTLATSVAKLRCKSTEDVHLSNPSRRSRLCARHDYGHVPRKCHRV